MKIYGVIGWKNAGKTSLMERLVAEFTARGYTVSTIKHVHHDVDLDQPGKDSHRHRAAGAREVILAGAHRFALMVEHRAGEPPLAQVISRLAPVDLVLIEGYKRDSHPKIEVWRAEAGHDLIQTGDPTIRAVATDNALPRLSVPHLDLNDTGQIADFIAADIGLGLRGRGRKLV
jgi:molybdopterin-guanine dinucleotide biosynthesis protein MobB